MHGGHVAAVDGRGRVLAALGTPEAVVFVRSAAKPFQAAGCLQLLAEHGWSAERWPGPEQLAVAWASHRAEPDQLAAVRGLLARSGTAPDELTCPPATAPPSPSSSTSGAPARIHHNCSGKHAMFALAGAALDCPRGRLLDPDGPLQRRLLATLEEVLGPPAAVAVDGCGAPAVAVPLVALARGYLRLLTEDRWRSVVDAGLQHPRLVGGPGRLTSALLSAGVLAKVGAEGVYGAAWRDEAGRPRALAVKAADGAGRAAAVALWSVVRTLDLVPAGAWEAPAPTGGGRPAGTLRAADGLRDLARHL